MSGGSVVVVGVGADGWDGLAEASRRAIAAADVIVGSSRQLRAVPDSIHAERVPWPSPMLDAVPAVLAAHASRALCVLASGDPMWFGIGATVISAARGRDVRVLPHPSSISLAAARMGWRIDDVEVVSLVGRPDAVLQPAVVPGRRLLVLVSEPDGAARVAALLAARGYATDAITVLSRLGGPDESISVGTGAHDPLAIIGVRCVPDVAGLTPLPRAPGLPDDAFESDGQLTKREVRALALAALAPVPGQLLWDVGAGSGSVGIEWMRTDPSCRAIAIEPRQDRQDRISRNATSLGVPALRIVGGSAPQALAGLPTPDAVFVGGGVSADGVLGACMDALASGGRLVANAVTLQSEGVLAARFAETGGSLSRVAVQRAEPVGGFTGWRAAMPVTQWSWIKP